MRTGMFAAAAVVVMSSVVQGHVTVWPRESQAGASERYTVRVPTEGQVATVAVELEVPADVTITGILASGGYTYEARKDGNRIVGVTWKQEIKAGEVGEFVFFARNPKTQQIAWKTRQRFADGTSADWMGVEGDRRPASVTRLVAPRP